MPSTALFRSRACLLAFSLVYILATSACGYFATPESRLQRARESIAQGDRRAALVELKNALQKQPELHAARILLADVALWLGDPASADAELQRVPVDADPNAVQDLRARIDLALGREDAVLERLSADPGMLSPALRELYRGLALLQQPGRSSDAETAFRNALQHDSDLIPAHAGLAQALAARGENAQAAELAGEASRRYPDSAELAYVHGMLLTRVDSAQALTVLQRARELAPAQLDVLKRASLLATLVDMHLANRNLEDARTASAEIAKLAPGSPLSIFAASRVAMASNDYVAAAADLRRLVNAMPNFAQARFMLGVALAAQGNLEQASKELTLVVEQNPQFLEARQLLGQVRLRLNDPDGALQVLVAGLDGAGGTEFAGLLDAARMQASDGAKTVEVLEKALASAPDNEALEQQLAAAYLDSGEADKALALLRKRGADTVDPRREALILEAIHRVEGAQAARTRLAATLNDRQSKPQFAAMGAAFLARAGEMDAARDLLAKELARNPAPELYFALAQLEWTARRPAAARASLEKLLASRPDYAPARLALAELELLSGRSAESRAQFEAIRKQDAKSVTARLRLAQIALAANDPAQAEALIGEVLEIAGDKAETRARAANVYLSAGRYDQAIQHLQAGLKADASSAALWLQLGRAQSALSQHGPARESFDRALALQPGWLPAEGALVFLDLQTNANEAALARVNALRKNRPQDASVAALEGQVHLALRQYAAASAAFERAGELQPTGAMAANAYQARLAGKLPDPTAPLERWVAEHPDDLAYRTVLANAHTQAGNRAKAIEHYEHILRMQPQQVEALNNLAWLYYELKDPRALELARKASSAAPGVAAVSDTLGWILVETGAVEQGLPILERAAAGETTDPEIKYHYGAALIRGGQTARGRDYLRSLLKDHPSFPSRAAAEQLAAEPAGLGAGA